MAFCCKNLGLERGGRGKRWKFSGRRRERRKGGRPERSSAGQDLERKTLARCPSRRPPPAASGRVSALSGISSSGCTPSARPPPPRRPLSPGPGCSACGRSSPPTRPRFYLACSRPAPPARSLPRNPNPWRRPSPLNSGARDSAPTVTVTRPAEARLDPAASPLERRVRAGASTRPARWLAGAHAHAPERASGRGAQLEPGRGRCGSAGAPAPRRHCDSQPAGRLGREAEKGAGGGGAASRSGRVGGGARRRRRRLWKRRRRRRSCLPLLRPRSVPDTEPGTGGDTATAGTRRR